MSKNKFSEVEIRKVKINKNSGLDVTFIDNDFETSEGTDTPEFQIKGESAPVNSVNILFRLLVQHMLLINEYPFKEITADYIKNRKIIDDPKFKSYSVTGFVLTGDHLHDDNAKVKLIGEKQLASGEVVSIVTPNVRLYADSTYEFSGNLQIIIDDLSEEVKDYLNGKVAADNQLSLFDKKKESEPEEEEDEL